MNIHNLWHVVLWSVCRRTKKYDYGKQYKDQCESCMWYKRLAGRSGDDWGMCANKRSSRHGLLTFEHMGCKHFQEGEST